MMSGNGRFSFSFPDINLPLSHNREDISGFNSVKIQNSSYDGYVFIMLVSQAWGAGGSAVKKRPFLTWFFR